MSHRSPVGNLTENDEPAPNGFTRRDDDTIGMSISRMSTAIDESDGDAQPLPTDTRVGHYRLLLTELPRIATAIKELPEKFQESAYYLLTGLLTENECTSCPRDDDGG